jgi:hypothetical protein
LRLPRVDVQKQAAKALTIKPIAEATGLKEYSGVTERTLLGSDAKAALKDLEIGRSGETARW